MSGSTIEFHWLTRDVVDVRCVNRALVERSAKVIEELTKRIAIGSILLGAIGFCNAHMNGTEVGLTEAAQLVDEVRLRAAEATVQMSCTDSRAMGFMVKDRANFERVVAIHTEKRGGCSTNLRPDVRCTVQQIEGRPRVQLPRNTNVRKYVKRLLR